jgi:predicted helicase
MPETTGDNVTYDRGFDVSKLFVTYSSGIQTKRDKICVSDDRDTLNNTIADFSNLDETEIRTKYALPPDGRDWTVSSAKSDILSGTGRVVPFLYKPFDEKFIYYSGRTKGFVAYPRREVMQHIVGKSNLAMIVNRQTVKDEFSFIGVTKTACCHGTFYLGNRGQDYCCPLYLYPSEQDLDQTRRVNFDAKIHKAIVAAAKDKAHGAPDEVAIFDYIYGVLHCPVYRETYREFLKIDFPRVPYPPSPQVFWDVSAKGTELRKLHLMEDAAIGETPYKFTGAGDSVVGKVEYDGGVVRINKGQGFEGVPEIAWNFHIGGYQPAQKWLKDRKSRALSFDDIRHYQKIIKILSETDRIMKTITVPLDGGK